jgi:hypothetical protein
MQLNWFLKSKLQLSTDLNSDMFFAPFSFKWNDVFWVKRRRFIHCFKKKKKKKRKALNDAVLNGTVGLLLPLHTQRQGKKNCLPLHLPLSSFLKKNPKRRWQQPHHLLKLWPMAYHKAEKQRGRAPRAALRWLPRPPYPCATTGQG